MLKINNDFVKRRWLEFRTGYSTYLIFMLGFSNFILILYGLAPTISGLIDFVPFVIIVFFAISIISTLIGHNHLKKQYPTEQMVLTEQNPFVYLNIPKSKEEIGFKINVDLLNSIKCLIVDNIKDENIRKEHVKILDNDIAILRKILDGQNTKDIVK